MAPMRLFYQFYDVKTERVIDPHMPVLEPISEIPRVKPQTELKDTSIKVDQSPIPILQREKLKSDIVKKEPLPSPSCNGDVKVKSDENKKLVDVKVKQENCSDVPKDKNEPDIKTKFPNPVLNQPPAPILVNHHPKLDQIPTGKHFAKPNSNVPSPAGAIKTNSQPTDKPLKPLVPKQLTPCKNAQPYTTPNVGRQLPGTKPGTATKPVDPTKSVKLNQSESQKLTKPPESQMNSTGKPAQYQNTTLIKPSEQPKTTNSAPKQSEPQKITSPKPSIESQNPTNADAKPGKRFLLLLNPESGNLEPVATSPEKEKSSNKVQEKNPTNTVPAKLKSPITVQDKVPAKAPEKNPATGLEKGPVKVQEKSPVKIQKKTNDVKSSVHLLKSFRKEKPTLGKKDPLIATIKKEKVVPKASVSIEIKTDGKKSEYDFESSSPPNKIMSLQEYTQSEMFKGKLAKGSMTLQEFRKKCMNGNGSVISKDEDKKEKPKTVPSLYRINADKKVNGVKDEVGSSPRVINIKTPPEGKGTDSPPKPIKIENKGGEYSIKHSPDEKTKKTDDETEKFRQFLKRKEAPQTQDGVPAKKTKISPKISPASSPKTPKPPTPVDMTKVDPKNPLQNLMEMLDKSGEYKDQNMLQMLITIAQKQSMEPLLKVPQYPPGSSGNAVNQKNISEALHFFQKLSSDMTILEGRSQTEQNLPPKPNFATFQKSYQQQLEVIRMLKRMQSQPGQEPSAKVPKLSPAADDKKSPRKEETTLTDVERTLSKIQEQAAKQSRLFAQNQNFNMYHPLFSYYNHPGSPLYQGNPAMSPHPNRPSPLQPSQTSPTSNKTPGILSPEQQNLLQQQQQQLLNLGLTLSPEKSFHQMYQKYLVQQSKLLKRKPPVKILPNGDEASDKASSPLPSPKAALPSDPVKLPATPTPT